MTNCRFFIDKKQTNKQIQIWWSCDYQSNRCQDGMVLIPREMSRWYGFYPSWDVKMVWFSSLVRYQDSIGFHSSWESRWYDFYISWVILTIPSLRLTSDSMTTFSYSFDPSWDVVLHVGYRRFLHLTSNLNHTIPSSHEWFNQDFFSWFWSLVRRRTTCGLSQILTSHE